MVLAARSGDKLEALASEINGLAVPTDVSRLEDLTALIQRTLAAHGRIDVLVNNAAANARHVRQPRPRRDRERDRHQPEGTFAPHPPRPPPPALVARRCRERGVALCVVSPGPIATPFVLDDLDHVPDRVFSQPILTAEQVADAVVARAIDRRRERAIPRSTLLLAKLSGTFPALQEALRPALEAKGAKVKANLRARASRDRERPPVR